MSKVLRTFKLGVELLDDVDDLVPFEGDTQVGPQVTQPNEDSVT